MSFNAGHLYECSSSTLTPLVTSSTRLTPKPLTTKPSNRPSNKLPVASKKRRFSTIKATTVPLRRSSRFQQHNPKPAVKMDPAESSAPTQPTVFPAPTPARSSVAPNPIPAVLASFYSALLFLLNDLAVEMPSQDAATVEKVALQTMKIDATQDVVKFLGHLRCMSLTMCIDYKCLGDISLEPIMAKFSKSNEAWELLKDKVLLGANIPCLHDPIDPNATYYDDMMSSMRMCYAFYVDPRNRILNEKSTTGYIIRHILSTPDLKLKLFGVDKSVIVFVRYANKIADLVDAFKKASLDVCQFYGDMSREDKLLNQRNFSNKQPRIIVCTSAFGLDVDIGDLEHVLNAGDAIQQTERAGRRGQNSTRVTFTSQENIPEVEPESNNSEEKSLSSRNLARQKFGLYKNTCL
ncbi:hypothetical protein V8B55DRAFT_1576521 [Mucor lusitanicus]